ncbi:flagellar FliJ family protein [Desulfurispirillum indicum]|uniref:Flagellar FliJ protein n=1 Tax=Desulfurispirillum indicum (strain ATCC BAA-1389 / DSM 22839 / S5) TaxID=653733 RepID=E6W3Q0_DESIS|nr:flagellar FliJ family protein [Desulfurispirillum indicum]ADU66931.1 hypothetical protein Selin_2211 [Desulfurispirillum indicum S5]UCZ56362.1 flagellar FliJ family protein [Desulfurispirillum indicum]
MAFRFRFQKVLEHRQRQLDMQQKVIAEFRRKKLAAGERKRSHEALLLQDTEHVRQCRLKGDMATAQLFYDYLPAHTKAIRNCEIEIASLENEIRRATEKLKDLFKQKRSLEFLRDRDLLRHQEHERREEEKMLAEINTIKYATNQREGVTP